MPFIDPYDDLRPTVPVMPADAPWVDVGGRPHELAPTRARVYAGLVDFACYRLVLIVLAAFWAVVGVLHSVRGDALHGPPPVVVVLYVGFTLVFLGPLTWRNGGQSVGKRLLGIRVVRTDGSPVTLSTVLVRETLFRAVPLLVLPLHTLPSLLDVVLLGIGLACLLYGSDLEDRRTVWDQVAGTVVVRHAAVPLDRPSR